MSGKFVTLRLKVAVPKECVSPYDILKFLNGKLREDSGFFGEFDMENIVNIRPFEQVGSGRTAKELGEGHTLE
jgi:hypothetical protein